jgi:hypothetical protein
VPQTDNEAALSQRVEYGMPGEEHAKSAVAQAVRAIAYGGLIAGVLDGAYAAIVYGWMRGHPPAMVFQFVASGLLGPTAFSAGWTAVLGLALHFVIAFGAATTYWLVALRWPALLKRPGLLGPFYGLAVFAFMRYVVVPLSAVPKQPSAKPIAFLIALLPHLVFIGPAIVIAANWSALRKRSGAEPSSN